MLLLVTSVSAVVAYQTTARQREYLALLNRGDLALQNDQTFGAIEAYSGAVALRPDSMLAHLRRGNTYLRRADLDAAARDFRTASELDPFSTRPLEALGDVLSLRGRFAQAAEAYEANLDLDNSGRVMYKLALARYRGGDIDGALGALAEPLPIGDELPDAHYLRGICLREAHRLADAVEAFEQAVALSPGMIQAREELADLYGTLGHHADELLQLQVLADLDRSRVERQVAIGLAHARIARTARTSADHQRHSDLAILALGGALDRTPDDPQIYGAIGQVWLDIAIRDPQRPDALGKALEALQRVASAGAVTSEALGLYGRALLMDGQVDAAERVLQQATRRYPVDPAVFLEYSTVAERQDHFEAARRALLEYGVLVAGEPSFSSRAARIGAALDAAERSGNGNRLVQASGRGQPGRRRAAGVARRCTAQDGRRDLGSSNDRRRPPQGPGARAASCPRGPFKAPLRGSAGATRD